MPTIQFTKADVRRLFRLKNTQEVETLIAAKCLDISAYTCRGRPLFDADAVRRAAERMIGEKASAP
jgi:hypothetical protein